MAFEDRNIVCKDCGAAFVFTEGEQAFYLEKGLLNEPQRCAACRARRRRERAAAARVMSTVTCAVCGLDTTVPFVPRRNKPVYCSACFEKVRSGVPA